MRHFHHVFAGAVLAEVTRGTTGTTFISTWSIALTSPNGMACHRIDAERAAGEWRFAMRHTRPEPAPTSRPRRTRHPAILSILQRVARGCFSRARLHSPRSARIRTAVRGFARWCGRRRRWVRPVSTMFRMPRSRSIFEVGGAEQPCRLVDDGLAWQRRHIRMIPRAARRAVSTRHGAGITDPVADLAERHACWQQVGSVQAWPSRCGLGESPCRAIWPAAS